MPVGAALQELIRVTPQKYDPQALQALLIQVRRDAVGSNRVPMLDANVMHLSAGDVDLLASTLQHKVTKEKVMFLT
jgi:predicted lipid carrier protein YhbT